jgi:hypothetical protein
MRYRVGREWRDGGIQQARFSGGTLIGTPVGDMTPFVSFGSLTAYKRPGRETPWKAENAASYHRRERQRVNSAAYRDRRGL